MMRITRTALLLGVAASAACTDSPDHPSAPARAVGEVAAAAVGGAPVYAGPEMDYQSSLVRVQPAGTLMMAVERLNPSTLSGDLYLATSADGGATWTTPRLVVGTRSNERHPALVQLPSGGFALFYLVDEGAKGGYRIHRATSPDGVAWTRQGRVDLGWSTGGEINPSVIVDGASLTMTYHRLNGPSYVARSANGGATWDTGRTAVTSGAAALPRIARRAGDGRYLVTYQVSGAGGSVQLFSETSSDPYAWNGPVTQVSPNTNDHDSQPIVLEDGTFLVAYAQSVAGTQYNLVYRRSADGAAWSAPVQLTGDADLADIQPHPILHGTPGRLVMAWTRQKTTGTNDYDIWVDPALVLQ